MSVKQTESEVDDRKNGNKGPSDEIITTERRTLTGVTSPWNTCCVWDARILRTVGFLQVSEGSPSPDGWDGGVEEVATLSLLYGLSGGRRVGRLMKGLKSLVWDTGDLTGERKVWHERKMESKVKRAEGQRILMGMEKGEVEHTFIGGEGGE
ncbi:hypothetical protein TrCOL_g6716 [Triparma columacea]|uniref:Uncharacterized protein n=1 Tax=Triparma columacea TaxID=722753 RepID=A0A9W7L771_9STRA|nr:hypothetical protein TrCOL_g6716 [Triparma columacea]